MMQFSSCSKRQLFMIVAAVLVIIVFIYQSILDAILSFRKSNDEVPDSILVNDTCVGAHLEMPVWSWGLSKTCCDVAPSNGENTSMSDPNYFLKNTIQNNSVVYVQFKDFFEFVTKAFVDISVTTRINLVTGMEDYGAPFEIMSEWSRLKNTRNLNMRQFLSDRRLNRWYTQNYDLVGYNPTTRNYSDVTKDEENEYALKVYPIPIGNIILKLSMLLAYQPDVIPSIFPSTCTGLDFHSFAGKGNMESFKFKKSLCWQRMQLETALQHSVPFQNRSSTIVVSFDCNEKSLRAEYRKRGRAELCRLVQKHPKSIVTAAKRGEKGRTQFWMTAVQHAFAFAPLGRGIDTHRIWELLNLKTVPIVETSPLDRLYREYPIVIVIQYEDAFDSKYLQEQRLLLQKRFGLEPFNADVMQRLTLQYWIDQVNTFR